MLDSRISGVRSGRDVRRKMSFCWGRTSVPGNKGRFRGNGLFECALNVKKL